MRSLRAIVPALLVCLLSGGLVQAQSGWKVSKTFRIGGEGGWDYVTADPDNHRLFVPRSTHTMILDADSGKTLGDVPGQRIAHGVAIVPRLNRGFITDGGESGAVIVFDLKSYSVLGRLAAVPDADGIIYDPGTDQILISAGDSNSLLTFKPDIDPQNGKIDAPIPLEGAPEFLAADGQGKAYVNLEDKSAVAVVDLHTRKVVARWPVAPGGQPVGMSMDPKQHLLLIGCRKPQQLVVMNAENGKVEDSLPIGVGVDATAFYDKQAFASCRDGSLTVAYLKNGKLKLDATVKTPEGARTLAVDRTNHRLYLPTAEFEPTTAGRPKAKPGTFMILVVERH
jgi:DNA-binding beta-propeller fold protein YncE